MNPSQFADTLVSGFINKNMAKPAAHPAPSQHERSLAKGILAGLAAGIIATAAKTVAEKIYPPHPRGESKSTALATKEAATEGIHWGFGLATGAAYGALAEFYPAATSREGVSFGMTLMALTHESSLGATTPATQPTREKTSEMASHIIFGLVTETVRRHVRKLL